MNSKAEAQLVVDWCYGQALAPGYTSHKQLREGKLVVFGQAIFLRGENHAPIHIRPSLNIYHP